MALHPCHECGQQLSTEAASCPHCGAPGPAASLPVGATPAQRDRKTALGAGGVLVIGLVVLVALGNLMSARGKGRRSDEPGVDLRVAALPEGPFMKIASGESESVSDCRIRINRDGLTGGLEYWLGTLSANEERLVPLGDFLNGSERFDPARAAVTFLTVSCRTSRGRGYWGWKRR